MGTRKFAPQEGALATKLSKLLEKNPSFVRSASKLRPLNEIGADGVGHINMWYKGKTDLGKALSLDIDLPFTHPVFGRFTCLKGFWHYVVSKSHDDAYRDLTGGDLRKYANKDESRKVLNFRAAILQACWIRIKSYSVIADSLKASTLPLDSYYRFNGVDSGVPIRDKTTEWFVEGMELIRKALKDGVEPDFTRFMNAPEKELLADVLDDINSALAAPVVPQEQLVSAKKKKHPKKKKPATETKTTTTNVVVDEDTGELVTEVNGDVGDHREVGHEPEVIDDEGVSSPNPELVGLVKE